ncbi:MAG TPA: class I SAM-dependent methyltransferase [Gaiellaceae bacterium]|nr:class I SAM-dependent methyltransferase [Gaiellaceae bacterium]
MTAAEHPHYSSYDATTVDRLDGFYGEVDRRLNELIADAVVGPKVLDFGCGYGSLTELLRQKGFDAVGIDLLASQVEAGKRRFPEARLEVVDETWPLPYDTDAFDTVVLRESLHHVVTEALSGDAAIAELARITARRLVVLEPNPSVQLKLARTLIGHVDPTLPAPDARRLVEAAGFRVRSVTYHTAFTLPLSGGYLTRPLLPRRTPEAVWAVDNALVRMFGRRVAWRYLLVADKA